MPRRLPPRIRPALAVLAGVLALGVSPVIASVVGHSEPAPSLTQARIDGRADAARWSDYLKRSQAQRAADKAALAAELKPGQAPPAPPPEGHGVTMPLDRAPEWYASSEARHVADVIVSFQTPAGGWGKNQRRDGPPRQPGQPYVADNISKYLAPDDFDTPLEPDWNYVGTLDNDATSTEMRFLGLVIAQAPGPEGDAYRQSFLRGIDYLLNAQYPNGGWPQVWPLEGGYHDAITYNDDAVTLAAGLLTDTAAGRYPFVPPGVRARTRAASEAALRCILDTQVKIAGQPMIWAQQHDMLTLRPVSGRNFEPAELSSDESANILMYLMSLPHPSDETVAAIKGGIAYFHKTGLHDVAWVRTDHGRDLIAAPGAPVLWARYYSVSTGKPVFGDRDKSVHDNVSELTLERRNGYSWFNTAPQKAIDAYADWVKAHP
jgi:PelA/Pel-15E family pectate lyase